ncbi:hypothetical protein ABL78_1666 [Leptomonas seymouri]|uniref:EamA domain-containing protein n=1 Tax=Leptomonas seymouri TaxID=5684 RepID=A0A0N1IAC3_LEPSE|nr:hypothetical protein ABL78_1666 [Leptomonas seymouri]|eukprot:KPI89243.1 hypothetical protein ABL78_1666 [Leptomonas seymouri]
MAETISTATFIGLTISCLLWGTAQTLSLKWADNIGASDDFTGPVRGGTGAGDDVTFQLLYSFAHPITQAFFMFCGELCCFVVFVSMLAWKKYTAVRVGKYASNKCTTASSALVAGEDYALPFNACVWLLPSGADFLGSIIQNIGLTLTYASVYQMLRGATVAWIAVFSYFWQGRRFTKVELWGMGFVMLGISLLGISSVFSGGASSYESERHTNLMLGNLLIISAQILQAYQVVCEERLVHLYKVPPLQMVGMEGLCGVGMTLTLLAFLQLVPTATWGHNLVAMKEFSTATGVSAIYTNVTWIQQLQPALRVPYDDIVLAFAQVRGSWLCLLFILIYVPAGFFYNTCNMSIIKYVSAADAVMLSSLRNVTVWLVCLMTPSIFGERFNPAQLLGFLLILFGNVLFQRVWVTHCGQLLPAPIIESWPMLFKDSRWESGAVQLEGASPAVESAEGVRSPLRTASVNIQMQRKK